MATMKAVRMHAFGGPEVLRVEDIAMPEPQPGEVLIRVEAASVNPVDWKIREGEFPPVGEDKLPMVPGRDISGQIVAIGSGVVGFDLDDEVFAFLDIGHGGYEQFVIAGQTEIAHKPKSLSHVQAAAVPLAGMTAWQGLFDHGGLKAGQRVLIHGGSGGVGHLAIQFARARGAWVATTVSGDDVSFATSLGADQVIDYKAERFENVVEPVDMVFDLISGETRTRSFGVLKKGGILVSTLGPPDEEKGREHGIRTAGFMARPDGDGLEEISRLIDDGTVTVSVKATYPLEKAAEAQRALREEHTRGKIVLDLTG